MAQVDSSVPREEQSIQDIFRRLSTTKDLNSGTYRVNPHLCVMWTELVQYTLFLPGGTFHFQTRVIILSVLLTKVLCETR